MLPNEGVERARDLAAILNNEAQMSTSHEANKTSIVRLLGVVGCLMFLIMALKIGVESWHARSAGSLMSNWKGGTMDYQYGFKLAAVFAVFAGAFFYLAVRGRLNR